MRLRDGFVTHMYRDQQLMVATGPAAREFHGLVRSNETAAFIVDQLRSETTEAQIVAALLDTYDVDRPTAETCVGEILAKLRSIGAIV